MGITVFNSYWEPYLLKTTANTSIPTTSAPILLKQPEARTENEGGPTTERFLWIYSAALSRSVSRFGLQLAEASLFGETRALDVSQSCWIRAFIYYYELKNFKILIFHLVTYIFVNLAKCTSHDR
jgi:hypothetical protein